jgi:hypothetical protein
MRDHGMILVSRESMLVPTCLCGWIGAGEKMATAFGLARKSWEGHVELTERITNIDTTVVEIGDTDE